IFLPQDPSAARRRGLSFTTPRNSGVLHLNLTLHYSITPVLLMAVTGGSGSSKALDPHKAPGLASHHHVVHRWNPTRHQPASRCFRATRPRAPERGPALGCH